MSDRDSPTSESPEKRQAILQQAVRTFAELGFRGTDVQVIADRAGVGKGTVYRYFGNKEDLFWHSTFDVFLRLRDHLLAAMETQDSSFGKVRAMCLAYGRFFDDNPVYLHLFINELAEFRGAAPEWHQQHHEELIQIAAGVLQAGIEAGEFRPLDTRKTTVSLGGVLYGTVVFSCYAKHNYTLAELIEHTVDVYLSGIRAEAGNRNEEQASWGERADRR